MMPGNQLSQQLIYGDFLSPDNLPTDGTIAYELGGIGLNNSSAGLQYQVWTAQIRNPRKPNSSVVISAPNTPQQTLFSFSGISQISLAFDQNMTPAIAFTAQGVAYLWWYDATVPGYVFLALPTNSYSPNVTLDDKRTLSLDLKFSDIILAYIRDRNLYFRQLRDRFTIEYILLSNIIYYNPTLYKIGMCATDRLLFQINADLYA